jgi:hypothetical protein
MKGMELVSFKLCYDSKGRVRAIFFNGKYYIQKPNANKRKQRIIEDIKIQIDFFNYQEVYKCMGVDIE